MHVNALYHLRMTFQPQSKVLGEHFYADSDLGPYTKDIHQAARDVLSMASPDNPVTFHFFLYRPGRVAF